MTASRVSVLILILIFPSVVLGQRISIDAGVDAGIPLTKSVQNPGFTVPGQPPVTGTVERPHFVVGPVVRANLGNQFSIEADTLYRPVRFQTQETSSTFSRTESITAGSLEVPVLGQFIFGSGRFRPTAGAGFVVYDKLSGAVDIHGLILSTGQQTHVRTSYRPDDSSSGPPFVASAGFLWEHSRFKLNPQLRYTRWSGNNTRNRSQWDILLGSTLQVFHRN